MIIACYVRKPALTALIVTLTGFESIAAALVDEVVLRRFADDPDDSWTTELREWVPSDLNTTIQGATDSDVATLLLDEVPVAVALAEIEDILLDVGERYLERQKIVGTLSTLEGASSSIKANINAAPHTGPP
jgi:hypothetical protein